MAVRRRRLLASLCCVTAGCLGVPANDSSGGNGSQDEQTSSSTATYPSLFESPVSIVLSTEPSRVEQLSARQVAAQIQATGSVSTEYVVGADSLDAIDTTDAVIVARTESDLSTSVRERVDVPSDPLNPQSAVVDLFERSDESIQRLAVVIGRDLFGIRAGVTGLGDSSARFPARVQYEYDRSDVTKLQNVSSIGSSLAVSVGERYKQYEELSSVDSLTPREQYQLLYCDPVVYTARELSAEELLRLRVRGFGIDAESWIPGDDGGSYRASVPLQQLSWLGERPYVESVVDSQVSAEST